MKNTSLARLALLASAAFAFTPAHAQVYKCVDGGRTIYSQTPCPSNSSSSTLSRTAPTSPAPGTETSGAPGTAEQEQAFRKRQLEQQSAAKKDGEKVAQSR